MALPAIIGVCEAASVRRGNYGCDVQRTLFDREPVVDRSKDPYAAVKAAGRRLAVRFGISEDRATDAVLVHGSEENAATELHKHWLLGTLDRAA